MMEDKIVGLFATVLNIEVAMITDESRPSNLERWDSLQHLILVSSFEEEFGIDIDPDEVVEMFEDFAAFKRKVLEKTAAAAN